MAVKKSELYSTLLEACNKLRGGVEPARYKDYVLLLLFFKYVSDRYKGDKRALYIVDKDNSYDALLAARNKTDVGEQTDKIIAKFLEANKLQGELPDVSFNNTEELGSGKELVDKVSGLIGVFDNPALDFRTNRASGDDIIGDAYEYFMMNFAQESGKSKGQFYTPSEVSRVIARLIGIGDINPQRGEKWTLYDPAAGSGSLLIRAADEAPVNNRGNSVVSIFGQEKDRSTAGLARMNFILHNKGTGTIRKGNSLADPAFTNEYGLERYDFVVMNPPFSDKSWSDGIKPTEDTYKRFDGYGVPPEKNGDYAWFLHVLKSMNSTGKAGIIMPHGILFRGNAEEKIRLAVLEHHYIKGIVSLPANLFYGTTIPACIVILDKENADERDGIFMIDASRRFKKDGNKNRLREQDIEKIVRVFRAQEEIDGYSRMVSYGEILKKNEGNLNVTRYIKKLDDALPQNVAAHLRGGIPRHDIDSVGKLWSASSKLRVQIFTASDKKRDIFELAQPPSKIEAAVFGDKDVEAEAKHEKMELFKAWETIARKALLDITDNIQPKYLIRGLGSALLEAYEETKLLDKYDVYDCLMNYWNEKLQDDVYIIRAEGYEAGREIEYEWAKSKKKDAAGNPITDKSKWKSFDGVLIPRGIIEREYFSDELAEIAEIYGRIEEITAEMDEQREEESGEDGLLKEVLNAKGDAITKGSLNSRLKELEDTRTSSTLEALCKLVSLLDAGKTKEIERLVKAAKLDEKALQTKNGFSKAKIATAIKVASKDAKLPEIYQEEYDALLAYKDKMVEKEKAEAALKEAQKKLDEAVLQKYGELSVDEIKHLLFDEKWMARLRGDIAGEMEKLLNDLSARVVLIAKRYEHTLGEIDARTEKSKAEVRSALERMGYKW